MGQQPGTPVDICNLALDDIGQAPIASILAPQTAVEDMGARWYDEIRRETLRDYIFNFARKPVILMSGTPPFTDPQYANAYQLPNDFVRLLTLGDRLLYGGAVPTQFYNVANGWLYTDANTDSALVPPPTQLAITALYRSGDMYQGTVVPPGYTVIAISGGSPLQGAYYTISGVLGTVQLNGNSYRITPGLLGQFAVYFLQTTSGQNFDSTAFTAYVSGGTASPSFVPPGLIDGVPAGLQVEYIFDAVTVPLFDPGFIKVVRYRLAAAFARKLKLPKSVKDEIAGLLEQAELKAAAISGQEKPVRRVQRSRVRDVRRSGGIFRNNTVI